MGHPLLREGEVLTTVPRFRQPAVRNDAEGVRVPYLPNWWEAEGGNGKWRGGRGLESGGRVRWSGGERLELERRGEEELEGRRQKEGGEREGMEGKG